MLCYHWIHLKIFHRTPTYEDLSTKCTSRKRPAKFKPFIIGNVALFECSIGEPCLR